MELPPAEFVVLFAREQQREKHRPAARRLRRWIKRLTSKSAPAPMPLSEPDLPPTELPSEERQAA